MPSLLRRAAIPSPEKPAPTIATLKWVIPLQVSPTGRARAAPGPPELPPRGRGALLLLALEDGLLLDERPREVGPRRDALDGDRRVGGEVDRRAEQRVLAVEAHERLPASVDGER